MKKSLYQILIVLLIFSMVLPESSTQVWAKTEPSRTQTVQEKASAPQPSPVPSSAPDDKAITESLPDTNVFPAEEVNDSERTNALAEYTPSDLVVQNVYGEEEPLSISETMELSMIQEIRNKYTNASRLKAAQNMDNEPQLSITIVRELMLQGATTEDIYEIAYLGRESAIAPMELLQLYQQKGLSWDELRELLRKTAAASVTDDTYGVTDIVYGVKSQLLSDELLAVNDDDFASDNLVTSLAATISSVVDEYKMDVINQTAKPQYSDRNLSSESVDPASGSLQWKSNQISLPGRDGLDLNIGVMYNSSSSEFISDSNIPSGNRNVRYDLGAGWSFRFPSLDYPYYHDGEGGTYKFMMDAVNGMEGSFLEYKGKDKRIFLDNGSFSNGNYTSTMYVEYANGKREYFGEPGLLGIVDRFGNSITFKYGLYWHSDMWNSSYLMTQIIDSVGRVVDFSYDWINSKKAEPNIDLPDENLTITVKDLNNTVSQKVVYTRARVGYWHKKYLGFIDGVDKFFGEWEGRTTPELKSITMQNGEQLKFSYVRGAYVYNTKTKPEKLDIRQLFSYEAGNELLSSIEYPNSRTVYEMGYQARSMGPEGSMDTPVVRARYDQIKKSGAFAGRYNEMAYSYNGSYDGYPTFYYSNQIPVSHTYSSVIQSVADNLKVTHLFNGKGQLLSAETVAGNGERKVDKNTAFHSIYTNYPITTETAEYGPGSTVAARTLYTATDYDEWGNVLSQIPRLTAAQWNNASSKLKNTITYTYQANYHLPISKSWYDSESASVPYKETYAYTAKGRLASYTNANQEPTTYTYTDAPNGSGKLYQVTENRFKNGALIAKSTTTYGQENQFAYPTVSEVYYNIGKPNQTIVKSASVYDTGTGRVKETRDSNERATSYIYDSLGRPTLITYPGATSVNGEKVNVTEEYSYTSGLTSGDYDGVNAGTSGLQVRQTQTLTRVSDGAQTRTYVNSLYNGFGLLLLESLWDEYQAKWVHTQYHYDVLGRPIYSADAAGNVTTAGYDAWGRQNRALDPNGTRYISDYSLHSNQAISYLEDGITGEKLGYVEDTYDTRGNRLSSLTYKDWPNKNEPIRESYQYNLIGQLVGYTDPKQNKNENGVTASYGYDPLGQLTSVKDALNQTTAYMYDGNGKITQVTIQAKGGSPQTLNTKTYNELGLLATKQDGASQSETYTYNNLGQLTGKTDRNGSAFSYTYDEAGQLLGSSIQGNVNGTVQTQQTKVIRADEGLRRLTMQTLANGIQTASQTVTTDSWDRIRNVNSVAGNHSAYVSGQWDDLGQLSQIQDYYLSFTTNYQYTKERLDKVQTNGSSTLTSAASANVQYSYLANNQVKSITYPTLTDGSILKTEYTYSNALGWTLTMKNTKGTSVLSAYSYGYDNNGNRISVSETRLGGTAQTTSYTYDALNRLVSITRPDGGKTTYTYDVRGNRQTVSDTGTVNLDLADTSYTYDLQNTLTSVTQGSSTTSFQYYADGMRFMKTNGSTQTQVNYDFQGQVISEEKIVGGVFTEQANFVRGDRVLVKKDKKASKDYYYLYNGHGDVVQIVNTSGAVVNNYTYDEWGNITSQVEGTSNSFKYTGEMYDAETGLYYLRARYYDPGMGRFLNEDTVEGQIDNPLSLNLYTYVENNPLIYSDPTGHYKDSDNSELRRILAPLTQAYNVAKNAGDKQAMIDAEKMADAIRVSYYTLITDGEYTYSSGKDVPSDVKYKKYTYNMLMESKYGNAHAVPLLEDPTFYLIDGAAALGNLVTKKVTTGILSRIINDESGYIKLDLQFFAKRDLKMVNDAAQKIGVDRDAFGEYIHELKTAFGMRPNQNFTYQELLKYAQELKDMMGN
ncbi:RHS repeat domain-containing protein [Paenibacillus sp. S150]|uniref:RHS repeat domain-containing protein n=1 Tax=Paenibacillus sp. S150 TaxID=2749826 RepID=UPI001C589943|nr:RHS repeat-associated core domain-containing protein [Paenibacillus sp. S150]MBW4085753.1 RHS repeat-associated core domain-containing protein [Paenibacillus sp. S150]